MNSYLASLLSSLPSKPPDMDNYAQYQNGAPAEAGQGQPPAQNGGAPGQPTDQPGAPSMGFPQQDGQGMSSPTSGQDAKTTLW